MGYVLYISFVCGVDERAEYRRKSNGAFAVISLQYLQKIRTSDSWFLLDILNLTKNSVALITVSAAVLG
jgi:hypothetical protein